MESLTTVLKDQNGGGGKRFTLEFGIRNSEFGMPPAHPREGGRDKASIQGGWWEIQNSKLKTQNWGGGREAYAPFGITIHRMR
jgi:hypothetical protein